LRRIIKEEKSKVLVENRVRRVVRRRLMEQAGGPSLLDVQSMNAYTREMGSQGAGPRVEFRVMLLPRIGGPIDSPYGGITKDVLHPEELAELRAAFSASGGIKYSPGGGPGAPATFRVADAFDTLQDAEQAVLSAESQLSSQLLQAVVAVPTAKTRAR
jgi:hypothetical protein